MQRSVTLHQNYEGANKGECFHSILFVAICQANEIEIFFSCAVDNYLLNRRFLQMLPFFIEAPM